MFMTVPLTKNEDRFAHIEYVIARDHPTLRKHRVPPNSRGRITRREKIEVGPDRADFYTVEFRYATIMFGPDELVFYCRLQLPVAVATISAGGQHQWQSLS